MISRRHFFKWFAALAASGATGVSYSFAEPAFGPRVTGYRITPRQWPSDLRLRIAVLADIHACEPWMSLERIEGIVAQTNALNPDITVMLGDYVQGHHHVTRFIAPGEWAPVLGQLKAPLGVHAILGNHDWWIDTAAQRTAGIMPESFRALERAGIAIYHNDAMRLTKDGRAFWLAGLGDQLAYAAARRYRAITRIGVDDLAATLAKVTDDAPVILLAHEPDIAMKVPSRVALQLSGHTHGGQVRLFGWSPIAPSRYGQRFVYGHAQAACDIIISGGLGCSIAPIRFGVRPEIVLVELGGLPKVA